MTRLRSDPVRSSRPGRTAKRGRAPTWRPQPAQSRLRAPGRRSDWSRAAECLRSLRRLGQTGRTTGKGSQPGGQLPELPVPCVGRMPGVEVTTQRLGRAALRGPWLAAGIVALHPMSGRAHLSAGGASTFSFLGFGSSSAAAIFALPPHLRSRARPTPSAPSPRPLIASPPPCH